MKHPQDHAHHVPWLLGHPGGCAAAVGACRPDLEAPSLAGCRSQGKSQLPQLTASEKSLRRPRPPAPSVSPPAEHSPLSWPREDTASRAHRRRHDSEGRASCAATLSLFQHFSSSFPDSLASRQVARAGILSRSGCQRPAGTLHAQQAPCPAGQLWRGDRALLVPLLGACEQARRRVCTSRWGKDPECPQGGGNTNSFPRAAAPAHVAARLLADTGTSPTSRHRRDYSLTLKLIFGASTLLECGFSCG